MEIEVFPDLWCAAGAGSVEDVVKLLSKGEDIQQRGGRGGATALHIAVYCGGVDMVEFLLENGADPLAEDYYGCCALHIACQGYRRKDRSAIIWHLIMKGADVNQEDNDGSTPLHTAVQFGLIGVVKILLQCGSSVGYEDENGNNVLHWSIVIHNCEVEDESPKRIIDKSVRVIKMLIEHGNNIYTKIDNLCALNIFDETPEDIADNDEMEKILGDALGGLQDKRRKALEALTQSQHPRLGCNSHVGNLSADVLQKIMNMV